MAGEEGKPASLNDEVRRIWNANAAFWDERMGEGNDFHRVLVEPSQAAMLRLKSGERVLDVACGNGQFARWMSKQGADVLAFDVAEVFVERAREKGVPGPGTIEYRVLDATDPEALGTIPAGEFDAAVCTMALMDMSSIGSLLSTLPSLLKPSGRFVFSQVHPCFKSSPCRMVHEADEVEEGLKQRYGVHVFEYIRSFAYKGVGMVGQPELQYYFHRPLKDLFKACFKAGFVLTGLEEPVFPEGLDSLFGKVHAEIPAALVTRWELRRV